MSAAHEWMSGTGELRSAEDALWAAHQEGGPPDREDTSVALALSGLRRLEHAAESAWPYGAPAWPADRPTGVTDQSRTLGPWRAVLPAWAAIVLEVTAGNAVVLTLAFVAHAWMRDEIDAEPQAKAPTNHAVLVVGSRGAPGGDDEALIVKNSWGSGWGNAGYGYVARRYVENFTVRAHVLESQ